MTNSLGAEPFSVKPEQIRLYGLRTVREKGVMPRTFRAPFEGARQATSVWIEHFRRGVPMLADALTQRLVLLHPTVIGELATGNLKTRAQTLADLRRQPVAETGTFEECLRFIEIHQLFGIGVGWSDVQILVSAGLSRAPLWTVDKRLAGAADRLGFLYNP